ncbi:MAG: transketolase family protein [Saprospiraceae bacterium]|nr:transketolase family protein [Saprospiraceae bacterium]
MTLDQYTYTEKKDTRSGFGAAMDHLGQSNPNVVALCADLTGSLKLNNFAANHPDRFFQAGIAEANMMGVAAGLTIGGKIPFATTFANFATSRVYDQIRQSISYSEKNVKIAASHSGITLGEDGATHQVLEDVGMMKMLPHMTVISTCDFNQTYEATLAVAEHEGPVYLRFGRPKVPVFMPKGVFKIGKAIQLTEGSDVSIFCHGHLVWECIEAARLLAEKGISAEVINIHTIKPLDKEAVLTSAAKTKAVVVAEEHQMLGGLGGSIAQVLGQELPTKMAFVAVNDTFGESGKPDQLMQKYGIWRTDVVQAVERILK